MGFTTPCFIRKNTEELRKRLQELGYIKNSPVWTDNCHIIWAYQYSQEKGFDIPHYVMANAFDIPFDKHSLLCGKFIDCGVEEDLFLAIAALRDDTDKNQWFTDGYLWFECGDEMCEETIEYYLNKYGRKFHKATVEELINHFK
ncbi:hypothetical protein NXV96_13005 [Bacteroides fragilis]|nr:hypothetical protein [Bacteroides fragilis]